MENFVLLGRVLKNINEYDHYLTEVEKLEVVIQKYYHEMTIPEYPCWLRYENERNQIGSISITSNLHKHSILSNLTKQIADLLNLTFLNKNFKFKSTKINLIRTTGMIGIHQDQGNRLCCINIGLKNSNTAITKISNDKDINNFENTYETLSVLDGYAYLMNTSNWHSVESLGNSVRYLITYNFSNSYSNLLELLNISKENNHVL
jgi:hypothetical protein